MNVLLRRRTCARMSTFVCKCASVQVCLCVCGSGQVGSIKIRRDMQNDGAQRRHVVVLESGGVLAVILYHCPSPAGSSPSLSSFCVACSSMTCWPAMRDMQTGYISSGPPCNK